MNTLLHFFIEQALTWNTFVVKALNLLAGKLVLKQGRAAALAVRDLQPAQEPSALRVHASHCSRTHQVSVSGTATPWSFV